MTERPRSEPVTGLVDSIADALLLWLFPARAEYERERERELSEPEAAG